jgi:hypothetical protein
LIVALNVQKVEVFEKHLKNTLIKFGLAAFLKTYKPEKAISPYHLTKIADLIGQKNEVLK